MNDWKRDLLSTVAPFNACNARQLDDFAHLASIRTLSPGEELCHQGDWGDDTYVIADGRLSVAIGEQIVAALGAGEVVGEQALLHGGRRNATVRAVEPTTLLVIDAREVDCMLAAVPAAARTYGTR
jgi:CRP-like cAMP-binding protein